MEYTVFVTYGKSCVDCYSSFENGAPSELDALIDWIPVEFFRPAAWCAERVDMTDFEASLAALYAESIAAGRLIEKTASGWVALGAEKQEEDVRAFSEASFQMESELRKVEPTSADLAMIARDGPAKPKCGCQQCGGTRGGVPGNENRLNGMVLCDYCTADVLTATPVSLAKPNPFPTTLRSPDCDSGPSDHLNASRHQMAAKQFHKA